MATCCHLVKGVRTISSCFFLSSQYQNLAVRIPLLRSFLSTRSQPQKELPFIANYLISSFGFSFHRALKVSANRNLVAVKSPSRPEAVVRFLNDTGLTDAQIRAVISLQPYILAYSVDKTFKPNVCELINGGCSQELLVQLIRYNPGVLTHKNTHSRLLFWRDFVGKGGDEALLKFISRNAILFTQDIDKKIVPVINLLKEYGLSNADILLLLQHGTRFISRNLDSLRRTLELIEELRTPRGSKKFLCALKAVGGISDGTLKRKVEFFKKTWGWSHEEIYCAFRKFPNLFTCSEEKVKSNMGFLLGKAGLEPKSVASNPVLIGYSLERVILRYTVLSALQAKGLKKKCSLSSVCSYSEKKFFDRFVVPYEKDVPGLAEVYVAAFSGKLPK